MTAAVLLALIGVLGTLSAGLLAGLLQARAARVQARAARADRREQQQATQMADVVDAVTALVAALADHRRAMFVLEDARICGADADTVAAALEATQVTRSAVTAPLTRLVILAPPLAEVARRAAFVAYAMRHAPTATSLQERRADALAASDHLVAIAGEYLTPAEVAR